MAIPTTGELSARTINVELGRSSTAELSIDAAENGSYVPLNRNSRSQPSPNNPAAYSEWYGYDHIGGIGPVVVARYRMGFTRRDGGTGANFACAGGEERIIYHQPAFPLQTWFASDSLIYQDPFLTVFAEPGTYSDQPFAGGFSARYWNGSRMIGEGFICSI